MTRNTFNVEGLIFEELKPLNQHPASESICVFYPASIKSDLEGILSTVTLYNDGTITIYNPYFDKHGHISYGEVFVRLNTPIADVAYILDNAPIVFAIGDPELFVSVVSG